jgi:hypothetical protein
MSQNEAEKLAHLYLTEVEPFYERHIDQSVIERARKRDRHYPNVWLLPAVAAMFGWIFVNSLAAIVTFHAGWYVAILLYTATYPMAKNKSRNIVGAIFFYAFLGVFVVLSTFLAFPEALHVLAEDNHLGDQVGIIGRILGVVLTLLLLGLIYFIGRGGASSEENALTITNAEMRDAIMQFYFRQFYPLAEWRFSERNQTISPGSIFPNGTCKAEFILTGLPVGDMNGLTVTQEVTRRVKKSHGEWETQTETIIHFRGVSVDLPSFSETLVQTVVLRPNRKKGTFMKELFTKKNPLELEDTTFEARYDVVAGNDFETRKLFTPLIMERLAKMPPSFYGAHFKPSRQVILFINTPEKLFDANEYGQREAIQNNLKHSHAILTDINTVVQTFSQAFL